MQAVSVAIDNRIRLRLGQLPPEAAEQLRASCTHENPEFKKRRALGYNTWNCPAKIKTWAEADGELSLPRGAMARLRGVLKAHGVSYSVEDRRSGGAFVTKPLRYVGHAPRGYQLGARDECLRREQGVVRAATGSGKTTTAMLTAAEIGLNALIVLPSVKLLDQTVEVAEQLLGLRGTQVGRIQGGERRLRPLTVATQQTLWSRGVDEELQDFFGCVIVDEAHHTAARTYQETIDKFPARYRLAFSADERRKDRMEFLVYDAFGQPIHETSRESVESTGAVVDVEVRIVMTDFRAPWYRKEADFNRLLEEMVADEDRNALVTALALEELRAGEKVIMCTHRREHVKALDVRLVAQGFRSGRMLGGQDAADEAEFEATRAGLRSGTVQAGVGTYGALGEGIDLPAVAVGVAVTPIASNKQKLNQFRGRLCRPSPGKTQGRLYLPFDRHVFDDRQLANVLAWNKTVKVRIGDRWADARQLSKRAILAA